MTVLPRRAFLVAAAAAACVPASVRAQVKAKSFPLKKIFPYWDAYLRIPTSERTRFRLDYYFRVEPNPSAVQAWYVGPDGRTPLQIGGDGRVRRLPTAAMMAGSHQIELQAAKGTKFNVSMELAPAVAPGTEISAAELAAAVAQANAGIRRAAGVIGFAAPKMARVVFKGAEGGQAVLADGRTAALPVRAGSPEFDAAALPQAHTLRFAKAPSRMLMAPAPKKG